MASEMIIPGVVSNMALACKYDALANEAYAVLRAFRENWIEMNRTSGYSRPIPPIWRCGEKLRRADAEYRRNRMHADNYLAAAEKAEREFYKS